MGVGQSKSNTDASVTATMRDMIRGFHGVYAVDVGLKLGLFERLAKTGPIPIDRFVKSSPYHDRYVLAWLRAVQAVGIVSINERGIVDFGEGWREALTDPNSDTYVGSLPACYTSVAAAYRQYPRLFRSGQVMDWRGMGKNVLRDVFADSRRFANVFVSSMVDKIQGLRQKLETGATVYDVGCGGGHFAARLAEEFPNTQVVGIDPWPGAIKLALQLKAKHNLRNVEFRVQSADEIPRASADIVILNEVIHEIEASQRLPTLKAIRRSLKSSGVMFVNDPLTPGSHAEYLTPSAADVAMMEFSEAPLVMSAPPTRKDFKMLLKRAGFGRVVDMESSDVVMSVFVKAKK